MDERTLLLERILERRREKEASKKELLKKIISKRQQQQQQQQQQQDKGDKSLEAGHVVQVLKQNRRKGNFLYNIHPFLQQDKEEGGNNVTSVESGEKEEEQEGVLAKLVGIFKSDGEGEEEEEEEATAATSTSAGTTADPRRKKMQREFNKVGNF